MTAPVLDDEWAAWVEAARVGLARAHDPRLTTQWDPQQRATAIAGWRAEVAKRMTPEGWRAELARRDAEVAAKQARERADREREAERLERAYAARAHEDSGAVPTWTQDADGAIWTPEGERWEGDEDPPGIDVRNLPRRPPRTPQDASAPRAPGKPRKKYPRRSAVPWAPLPPPPADTPWRVTRDVQVRTLSPNRVISEHFRSRATRRNREHGIMGAAFRRVALPDDGTGWIVTFTRVGPALLDHGDRLSGSLAAIRDAVADRLTGGDDSPRAPVVWVYRQHREVVREPHRYPARQARAADSNKGITARPGRPARDGWRYRTWLRVTIETATEHAPGGETAQCAPGERPECPLFPRMS